MAEDCAGSIHVCRIRVARLDGSGVPAPGADNLVVSDALIRLSWDAVNAAGDDIEVKNGCGEICVAYKAPDQLKRIDVALELCTPDPVLHEMLVGGEVLMDGADVVGWAPPNIGDPVNPNGVSIEAWSRAVIDGHQADVRPWFRWVLPRVRFSVPGKVLENGALGNPLAGIGEENTNFHDGPANDWPYTSDRVYQYARDDSIPDAFCGYQALAAS